MSPNAKADRSLDCIGLYCPEPVFRTRLELDTMALGETLEVVADDPAAESDIKSLVKRLGHVLVDVDSRDRVTRILIQKAT